MRLRVANLVLIGVGLLIALYPLTVGDSATITCRGVVMGPRDRCAKADGSEVQTYEQRVSTRRAAAPVVVGVGLLVAGFGAALLLTERRRADGSGLSGRTRTAPDR